jgi:hypothetical protein
MKVVCKRISHIEIVDELVAVVWHAGECNRDVIEQTRKM